jgi:hypothetical protein
MQILDSADHLINDLRFAEQRWSLVLSITAAVIVQSGNVWLQGKIPLEKNLILFKSVDLIDVRHNQIYFPIGITLSTLDVYYKIYPYAPPPPDELWIILLQIIYGYFLTSIHLCPREQKFAG